MEKRNKIIYWISTALLSFGMLSSGIFQLMRMEQPVMMFTHLGYPLYFLTILGVWKLLGVIAILVPNFPKLKEWAYAGFFFAMSGAMASHIASGDGMAELSLSIVYLVFAILSWHFRPANRKC